MATGLGGEMVWWCPSLDDVNNGSTTTISDLSGNGRHGTLTNIETGDWTADTDNGGIRCLLLDGVNEYISLTSPTFMSNIASETISMWSSRTAATHRSFFGRRGGTAYNNISVYSDSVIYWMIGTSKYATLAYTGTGWHHYLLAFDGGQSTDATKYRAYIDGVVQSLTFVGTPMPTVTPTQSDILSAGLTNGLYDTGRKDDMRVFNRAVTAAEVTLLASKRGYQPPFRSGPNLLMGVAA